MWKPSDPKLRRGGFTLLEVLLALILLTILLTLVFTAFFQISSGASRQKESLTTQQEIRLLQKLILDDLAAIRYLPRLQRNGIHLPSGVMSAMERVGRDEFSRLSFHAEVSARFFRKVEPARDPGLHEVGYRIEEDRGEYWLTRREDFYLDDQLWEGGKEVRLAKGVRKFKVEFLPFSPNPRDPRLTTPEDWQDRWDSAQGAGGRRLPRAIRLTLGLDTEDGQTWEETVEINLPANLKEG
ncbi:MAG: type II secretion system protein GspJ [Deltaproteobacteria bacterium]|nr:type II secretion system protein GspJ [Deltaproteobacteria bacterium]